MVACLPPRPGHVAASNTGGLLEAACVERVLASRDTGRQGRGRAYTARMRAGAPSAESSAEVASAAEALRRAVDAHGGTAVTRLVQAFHRAREDAEVVVLEGFHPLKHALRFGADVQLVVSAEDGELPALLRDHAPDLAHVVGGLTVHLPRHEFKRLGPYEPHTGVVSLARRPVHDPQALLLGPDPAPLVLLEDPRHRGNLGAVVRVAAAARAAGVLVTGSQDPWHPVVVRGSAGLHFALPVAHLGRLPTSAPANGAPPAAAPAVLGADGDAPADAPASASRAVVSDRPIIVLEPGGVPYDGEPLPARPILAFGSERRGVSAELRDRAWACLSLPMREGVSSLNLATSVAAVLYGASFAEAGPWRGRRRGG
jgi:tRNA G18 (ribose-2'-O)-methylase SpoU